ncbi:fumarylacetoacetate hydrolase family protein [Polyangium jinanense]|uniref:Fumarylacetoacetate hydrolase family protein n=1 Tax=Polyangium jinanense TaxID=2829994 RepID=A0A9X4AYT2_9BACT|nr:fumarylacetoacetate hydrolase family protein [Polyangium jinanense]MDC3989091.1 fumarylacetoacetate hydrolase family protein [Polyangium jinanense]
MTTFARIDRGEGRAAFARLDGDRLRLLTGAPWERPSETGEDVPFAGARLLAPVTPTKIVCVGRNYRAHAAELGNDVPAEPLLFFKPPSSIVAAGDGIELPEESSRVDHEAELGVVIGARCRRVSEERALDFVFGYTCVDDVTARDLQKKDGQWTRAKGFDTFCPTGPLLVTGIDPSALAVRCRVNGEIRQDGNTRDMIFSIAQLIAYISGVMTLEPGDLIATGTPHGVGPIAAGDVVEVEVDGVGTLRNPVRACG